MKKILALVLAIAVVLLGVHFSKKRSIRAIIIGNKTLTEIEIVDKDVSRARGLSGRPAINEDYGMLFVFDRPALYGFWMRDMNFAIDIIWLDESGVIVGLEENVSPTTYPKIFYPKSPALYALEVSPKTISRENLKIGDKVIFQK